MHQHRLQHRGRGITAGRLHVFVQELTRDAPVPVGFPAPDHEEASSLRCRSGALRPAHPVRAPERCREVAYPSVDSATISIEEMASSRAAARNAPRPSIAGIPGATKIAETLLRTSTDGPHKPRRAN